MVITKFFTKNSPLWYEQFTKKGLKIIEHIWDRDRKNIFDENIILHRLTDKRNAIKHYRIIKSSINEGWVDYLKDSLNQ